MPPTIAEMLAPETLARIDSYALLARTAVEGLISGLHRSLYHGFGSEFFQYRSYVPGDDLKYVDWKVLSRRDRLYTKVYQEETNMNLSLVIDASASMDYQGSRAPCTKLRYACMAAACLAYLANRQGDSLGFYAYSDALHTAVHPGVHSGGFPRLITELHRLQPGAGAADHKRTLEYVVEHARRRGMVVLLSDCHGWEDELSQHLHRFRFAHHDCVLMQILDPDEADLPFGRSVRFVDSEDGAEIVTSPDQIRTGYQRDMESFLESVRTACLSQQVDYLQLSTADSLGHLLAAYLHRRESLA